MVHRGVGMFVVSQFSQLFAIPTDTTFWSVLNSQGLNTLAAVLVAFFVAKYGAKTAKSAAETATSAAEAANSAVETAASQDVANFVQQASQIEKQQLAEQLAEMSDEHARIDSKDFRQETRQVIADARQYIEDVVAKDPDKRHQRTYEAIARYDYIVLATALNARKRLSPDQLAAAAELFTRWKQFERGLAANKVVPEPVLVSIKDALYRLQNGKTKR
jgi:succinate dehydrogenase/fumarate reductase flavoprotein subunit